MKILENLRSLCFGATVGSLLLALAFARYPQLFPNAFSLEMAFGYGAAIGGAIHRLIELFVRALLRPIYNTVSLYMKLAQIIIIQRYVGREFISEALQKELIESLLKGYFIEEPAIAVRISEERDDANHVKLIK